MTPDTAPRPLLDLISALAVATVALAVSCGAAAQEPAASDPLEVKLVNADQCAPGWRLVSRDEGLDDLLPASRRRPGAQLDRRGSPESAFHPSGRPSSRGDVRGRQEGISAPAPHHLPVGATGGRAGMTKLLARLLLGLRLGVVHEPGGAGGGPFIGGQSCRYIALETDVMPGLDRALPIQAGDGCHLVDTTVGLTWDGAWWRKGRNAATSDRGEYADRQRAAGRHRRADGRSGGRRRRRHARLAPRPSPTTPTAPSTLPPSIPTPGRRARTSACSPTTPIGRHHVDGAGRGHRGSGGHADPHGHRELRRRRRGQHLGVALDRDHRQRGLTPPRETYTP